MLLSVFIFSFILDYFLSVSETDTAIVYTLLDSEYAMEGYELNVIDYLLNPIRFDIFFKAISKVLDLLKERELQVAEVISDQAKAQYIFVKSDYKAVKVVFDDILYVESMQKYVKSHLRNKIVISLTSISSLEELLPSKRFFRCQKSFIINLGKIESIEGNQLVLPSKAKVPVSKNLRGELLKLVDQNGLL